MSPWIAKGVMLASMATFIAIRAPHARGSGQLGVAVSHKGTREKILLLLVMLGFLLVPVVYIATPVLAFADYPPRLPVLLAGAACMGLSFWLFHRSHVDLGKNWSVTLEIREGHRLVERGVYARIRHPMYTAIFLYGIAQALVLPNWAAGPAMLAAFSVMYVLRVTAEEKMMEDQFGDAYREYCARTKRLVPGVL